VLVGPASESVPSAITVALPSVGPSVDTPGSLLVTDVDAPVVAAVVSVPVPPVPPPLLPQAARASASATSR
jgi:hypothetical protein